MLGKQERQPDDTDTDHEIRWHQNDAERLGQEKEHRKKLPGG
jgi:hypothetical protein